YPTSPASASRTAGALACRPAAAGLYGLAPRRPYGRTSRDAQGGRERGLRFLHHPVHRRHGGDGVARLVVEGLPFQRRQPPLVGVQQLVEGGVGRAAQLRRRLPQVLERVVVALVGADHRRPGIDRLLCPPGPGGDHNAPPFVTCRVNSWRPGASTPPSSYGALRRLQ